MIYQFFVEFYAHCYSPFWSINDKRLHNLNYIPGELSNLLTLNHDDFHAEKDDLLTTGLFHCPYLQVDDTGARHQGQNGYCTFIGSPEFAWFGSTESKSRENFLSLLHRPWITLVLNEHAMSYLEDHNCPAKWRKVFQECLCVHFFNRESWDAFLDDCGLTKPRLRQKASEAMLYLSFTTPIDIFLKPVVKGLIRYSGILFCHLFNTSSKA
ncbi:hypothetical protein [Endozoicomonas atrinae]|uniref:hypothetical protein n=1 Tax=Endozoicomonas atrinae TaxID=1333660 RepID=UPI003B004074